MLPLAHLALAAVVAVAAEPVLPRPALPTVERYRAEARLLGGFDTWPEDEPGVGELRLGAGYARSVGPGSLAIRYGGVLQAWQDDYLLDGHLLELSVDGGGDLAVGGLGSLRGSTLWGWSEAALRGSLRFASPRIWSRGSLGPVLRGGDDERAVGLALGLQGSLHISPRLSTFALLDGRGFAAEDFPLGYLEADLGGSWELERFALALGLGISAADGGKDDRWVAGLPPSGLTTLRAWMAPELVLRRGWALVSELAVERAGEDYARARFMFGVRGRLGEVRRSGLPPVDIERARFQIEAPGAQRVEVMGSFSGWEPLALASTGDGCWRLELPLEPGEHLYVYLVDGRAVVPPEALRRRPDGFGGENAVLVVAEAGEAPRP